MGYTLPFYFGIPTFSLTAILSMIVVMLITAVETTVTSTPPARSSASASGAPTSRRRLRADGLATTIGGVLNSFPYTCFAENVGLVRLTQVKSRWVVASTSAWTSSRRPWPTATATPRRRPGWRVGDGMAVAMIATIAPRGHFAEASVALLDRRPVRARVGTTEFGNGTTTVHAQLVGRRRSARPSTAS